MASRNSSDPVAPDRRRRLILAVALLLLVQLAVLPATEAADPVTPFPSPNGTAQQVATPTLRPTTATSARTAPVYNTLPVPNRTPTPSVKPSPSPSPTPGPKLVTRPPAVRAASAIAVDADTGKILYAKDIHTSRPQASTTKILTALTLLDLYPTPQSLQAQTIVVEGDLVGEANMGLKKGERIRLSTLLLGLLTNSANEAGMALARYAGRFLAGPADPVDRFVASMNTEALKLGMYESHFMNPHGLDQPGHYSSAYDLAISGWYALRNPLLMQYATYLGGSVDGHDFYNVNSFLTRYPGATGLKPGWTDEAGRCWIASARNNGHNVIVAILNTANPPADIDPLMDYAFTLLAGKADQPLLAVNLGTLNVPVTPAQPLPASNYNLKALQAALRLEIDFTLRLAISLF